MECCPLSCVAYYYYIFIFESVRDGCVERDICLYLLLLARERLVDAARRRRRRRGNPPYT